MQTSSSAEHKFIAGQVVRRRRAPLIRGLNRKHNRVLKDVFKGAATAAASQPGPLQEFYAGMVARGTGEEMARLTLARKLAAITLRLWKRGEQYDPTKLTTQRSKHWVRGVGTVGQVIRTNRRTRPTYACFRADRNAASGSSDEPD